MQIREYGDQDFSYTFVGYITPEVLDVLPAPEVGYASHSSYFGMPMECHMHFMTNALF